MNDSEHDIREKTPPEQTSEAKRPGSRRLLRRIAWGCAGFLVFLASALCAGVLFLRSQTGEAWLTDTVNSALHDMPGRLSFRMASFQGPLPSRAVLSGIVLEDEHGPWLEAEKAELRMDWSALPQAVVVSELSLQEPRLLRLPEPTPTPQKEQEPSAPLSPGQVMVEAERLLQNWPFWLPSFRIDELSVSRAALPASLLGAPLQASLSASASLSPAGANMTLTLQRDDASCTPFDLKASFTPEDGLSLNARGSDFGLAGLLPDDMGRDAALFFTLEGKGDAERLTADLTGRLFEESSQKDMLTVVGKAQLLPDAPAPQASVTLTLESGDAAARLWTLAGQKNGRLRATLAAQAT